MPHGRSQFKKSKKKGKKKKGKKKYSKKRNRENDLEKTDRYADSKGAIERLF